MDRQTESSSAAGNREWRVREKNRVALAGAMANVWRVERPRTLSGASHGEGVAINFQGVGEISSAPTHRAYN